MKAAWNSLLIAESDNISHIKTAFTAGLHHAKSATTQLKHQTLLKGLQVTA